jgi:hypothetical protein
MKHERAAGLQCFPDVRSVGSGDFGLNIDEPTLFDRDDDPIFVGYPLPCALFGLGGIVCANPTVHVSPRDVLARRDGLRWHRFTLDEHHALSVQAAAEMDVETDGACE